MAEELTSAEQLEAEKPVDERAQQGNEAYTPQTKVDQQANSPTSAHDPSKVMPGGFQDIDEDDNDVEARMAEEHDKACKEADDWRAHEEELQQKLLEVAADSPDALRSQLHRARTHRIAAEKRQQTLARGIPQNEEDRKQRVLKKATVDQIKDALGKLEEDALARMTEQELVAELTRRGVEMP